MQYMGGKSRIAKKLVNFMSLERGENMTWVEPFMGSGKVIEKVKGQRIGSDVNKELIALFKMIQKGYEPPKEVSEDFYYQVRENQDKYPDHLRGFLSFACSFGGVRWQSYAKNKKNDNYALAAYNSLMKQKSKLKGVKLLSCDYKSLIMPENSLIYCDPPYKNTAGYGFGFDHDEFYQWCIDKVKEGHLVFISEYNAPFDLAYSIEVNVSLNPENNKLKKTEKLFRVHKKQEFKLITY